MTYASALKSSGLLRSDHIDYNPVSASYEPFVLLGSQHVKELNQVDHLISGAGGVGNALYSTQFSQFSAYTTAPDGTNTAITIVPTANIVAGTTYSRVFMQGYAGGASNAYGGWTYCKPGAPAVLFAYVQAGTISEIKVQTLGEASARVYYFNLTTGALASGPTDKGVTLQRAGGDNPLVAGWWRVILRARTQNAANTPLGLQISMSKNQSDAFVKAATDSINLWIGGSTGSNGADYLPFEAGAAGFTSVGGGFQPGLQGGSGGPVAQMAEFVDFPVPAVATPQAMSVYMSWLDKGNPFQDTTPGVFRFGDTDNTSGSTGINVVQGPTSITGTYTNGASTSVSTVALTPALGDLVELRATLDATGALTLAVSLNGAAEVVGSTGSAAGLASSWSAARLCVNSLGSVISTVGDMALRRALAVPGTQALSALQALAA